MDERETYPRTHTEKLLSAPGRRRRRQYNRVCIHAAAASSSSAGGCDSDVDNNNNNNNNTIHDTIIMMMIIIIIVRAEFTHALALNILKANSLVIYIKFRILLCLRNAQCYTCVRVCVWPTTVLRQITKAAAPRMNYERNTVGRGANGLGGWNYNANFAGRCEKRVSTFIFSSIVCRRRRETRLGVLLHSLLHPFLTASLPSVFASLASFILLLLLLSLLSAP